MTTEEFVEAVNAIDDDRNELEAYTNRNGDIFLQAFDECPIALLGKHYINWDIRSTSQVTIPAKVLKLMVEMAESREEDNKYVILDGKPFLLEGDISTRVFLINEGNLSFATVSLDEMIDFSYTKAELEQMKATLPKNLQEAVDLLTVTVGEAKKILKNDND